MPLLTHLLSVWPRGWRNGLTAGATALIVVASSAPARAADDQCDAATQRPVPGAEDRATTAAVCVINRERASRGLPLLRQQRQLGAAAGGYARDMVRRHFFSHVSPGGASMTDRLRGGYLDTNRRWAVGEVLAWGGGERATPAAIVSAWLASPPHRRVVLGARYREIGVGVSLGVPVSDAEGATYAAELGVRR